MSFITMNTFNSNAWKLSRRDIVRSGLLLNLDANLGITGNTWLDNSPSQNNYICYRANNWTNTWNSTPGDANSTINDISTNIVNNYQVVSLTGTNNQFLYSTQNMGTTLNAGFTYEVWCYPTIAGNINVLLENKQNAVGNTGVGTFSSHIGLSANKVITGYDTVSVANTSTYSINNWYQIVETFDGVTVHQYVNGVYNNRTVADRQNVTSQRLTLGLSNSNGLSSFTGYIGALNVYNRSLSNVEVVQNYNAFCTRYNILQVNSPATVPVVNLTAFSLTTDKVDVSLNYTTSSLFNFMAVKKNDGSNNTIFYISNTNPTIYKDANIPTDLSYTYVLTPYNNNNIKGSNLSQTIFVSTPKVATGGTITDSNGYRFHTFTTPGTFTINSGITLIDALIVGGGYSGGNGSYGKTAKAGVGGNGGQVLDKISITVSNTSYSISVGGGNTGSVAFGFTASTSYGTGTTSSITGVTYGGKGGDGTINKSPGTAGSYGGGKGGGGGSITYLNGTAGTPSTGGGGGGAGGFIYAIYTTPVATSGGGGGSGIVVIRYIYS